MNSFNHQFEKQIKKQINEREVAPSRDLWSEIQAQTSQPTSKKSNINRFLMAACFLLVFGLGAVLFFDKDPASVQNTQLVQTSSESVQEETVAPKTKVLNSEKPIVEKEKNTLADTKLKPSDTEIVESVSQKNLPLIKNNPAEIASQIVQNAPSKIMARSDSAKVQKSKRYVDPSTLLFSVEHKDVIERSKDGSGVATIDLNTK